MKPGSAPCDDTLDFKTTDFPAQSTVSRRRAAGGAARYSSSVRFVGMSRP